MRRRRRRRRDRRPRGRPRAGACATTALRVAVLEREPRIAAHQTSHSSGVIHAGHLLRAGLAEGAALRRRARASSTSTATSAGSRRARTGKLIVATDAAELERLARARAPRARERRPGPAPRRRRRARARSSRTPPGSRRCTRPRPASSTSRASPRPTPTTSSAPAGSVVTGCAVDARSTTVTVAHAAGRDATAPGGGRLRRRLGRPRSRAPPARPPSRGSSPSAAPTCACARSAPHLVRANIYPVPDPELPFLGAHLTRGARRLGAARPDRADRRRARRLPARRACAATDLRETLAWPGTWRLARRFWRSGLTEIRHAASRRALVPRARRLVPELRACGLRRRPGRGPRPGARARRLAGRRLPRLAHRARPVRPQRPLARRDLVAAARAADRRRGCEPLLL